VVQAFLRRYARRQVADVLPHVLGRRVLDLGAGEAYVTAGLLADRGGWACAVDVGPFARARVPYAVYDGARLPFADGTFDTTLLLLVLHHCDRPEAVLDEAVRVTHRRLIVTESVARTPRDRVWLDLLDGRLNRLRHGGRMNAPLAFRDPAAWAALFASRGLRLGASRWLGSRWERLVHHPLLLVVDLPPPAARYTTSEVRSTVSPNRPMA
jgi:SAM-dependent methyltransferase